MNKKTLLEWENSHNAIKRTIEGFWECLKKWREEERDDYHETFYGKLYDEFIGVHERAIYLKYTFSVEEAVIFCSVHISYLDEIIGTYDIEFTLDGQYSDDYLGFSDMLFKERLKRIKHNLRIARSALKEGLEIETVSNITGIESKFIQILKEKYC